LGSGWCLLFTCDDIYIYHYIHLCKTFAIYHLFWEITIMSLMIHLGFMEQTHLGVIMFILATGNRLRTPVTWFYDISWYIYSCPLVKNNQFDPNNSHFWVETNLPTPMTARVQECSGIIIWDQDIFVLFVMIYH
jgi:hypothetical protein